MAIALGLAACNHLTGNNEYSVGSDEGADGGIVERGDAGSDAADASVVTGQLDASVPVVPEGKVEVVAPNGLAFGDVNCGSTPPARLVEVRNGSPHEITFVASLSKSELFSVAPALGVVPSGGVFGLSVSSPGAPQEILPATYTDQLDVTTTGVADDPPHVLDVALATIGAVVSVTPNGTFDFGHTTSQKSKVITIRNDGNVSVAIDFKVTSSVSGSFSLSPATPAVIPAGGSETRSVIAKPPKSGSPTKTGTLSFSLSMPVCGALPSPISLKAFNND